MSKSLYEERFGFLASDIARLMGTQFERRGRQRLVLSRAQCRMALYLATLGPMSQAKLAETLEVTPMTVARMLDRMEEAGWVTRVPAPNDRRAFLVRVTDGVHEVLGQALILGDEIAEEALRGLTDEEKRTLTRLLRRIRANLSPGQGGSDG
jgi:DNA-binding MarR family transcriptional regulator